MDTYFIWVKEGGGRDAGSSPASGMGASPLVELWHGNWLASPPSRWTLWILMDLAFIFGSGISTADRSGSSLTLSAILLSLWTSGTKCLYCVSNLSNLGLKLLKKISILSQTCLGQNVSIWSQFETFLTIEIQLRLSLFESNLRHFSALSKKCQKGLKKGFGEIQWMDGLFRYLVFTFKLYDFTIRILWYKVQ